MSIIGAKYEYVVTNIGGDDIAYASKRIDENIEKDYRMCEMNLMSKMMKCVLIV